MYQTPKINTTIKLYRIIKFDGITLTCVCIQTFNDKNELIDYLAQKINTYGYYDPERWYCSFLHAINHSYKDKDVDLMLSVDSMPRIIKPYVFLDAYDKLVNIKDYWPDIIKYVHYKAAHPVNPDKQERRNKHAYRKKQAARAWATQHTKSHTYIRSHYSNRYQIPGLNDDEYKEFCKPRYTQNTPWDAEYTTHGSAGWKNKKARYQWQKHMADKGRIKNKAERNTISEQMYLESIGIFDYEILDTIDIYMDDYD